MNVLDPFTSASFHEVPGQEISAQLNNSADV
jgi:hypothetical protein